MPRLAFLTDHLTGAFDLARHALIRGNDLVERIGNFARDAGAVARQAHAEIAVAHSLQCSQQFAQIEIGVRAIATLAVGPRGAPYSAFLSGHGRAPTRKPKRV